MQTQLTKRQSDFDRRQYVADTRARAIRPSATREPITIRPAAPRCPRCCERRSAYALADERGNFLSDAGCCDKCLCRAAPDEADVMREEIAAHSARFSTPASPETIERAGREWRDYQNAANDGWGNDNLLLLELQELRARYAYLGKSEYGCAGSELDELAERIDEIERDFPFLEDPDFGVQSEAPFPELL